LLARWPRAHAYVCTNQRTLHRRFLRHIGILITLLLILSNVFHYLSARDRVRLHDEYEQMRRQAELNRKMLDARARIQTTLIKTGLRRGAFTAEEIQILNENWERAEYSEIEKNPFE
jgi:hypothetical protein